MGFLAPWFLLGALAIGLPIWLHLLRQHRRTPQPFSSLMFFERRVQASTKHRRLKYLLLLALRLALILLLALAFANPFVYRSSPAAAGRVLELIAIDRSFSMRESDRMSRAHAEAHRILNSLSGNPQCQILAVDSRIENVSQQTQDRSALAAAIDSVQPGDRVSSYGEFARMLRALRQTANLQLGVHFVSDMQQTSMPPAFADLDPGPATSLDLRSVGTREVPNWAVTGVTAPSHVYNPKQTRVIATIAGWQTPAAVRSVSLVLDGKMQASKEVSVPANGRAQVEFLSFDVPYGMHRGEVRIEPHDGLAADDTFYFSTERSDPRAVLFLYAGGRSRSSFYYRAAMDSASDTGLLVQPEPVERAASEDFSKYAFVVLDDLGGTDDALERDLGNYVRKGGAVLVTLGPASMRLGRVPLTGLRFSELRETQGTGSVDNNHSALRGIGRFENVRFFEAARLDSGSLHVLARLADGSPLLVEQAMGEGRILTFTSAFDNVTNDFPLHSSFVPFVAQTGRYLAGSADTPSSSLVGSAVPLRRAHEQGVAADVIGPDGKHALSLNEAASASEYELACDGFYEVQGANGRRTLVAANADRRESDLTPIPEETLALWRNMGSAAAQNRTATGAGHETQPWSFWRYVLIFALMAVLMESVVGSRYLISSRRQ